jgi:hypothetical protein
MSETKTLTLAEAGAALDEIESRKAQLSAALAEVGSRLERAEGELGEAVLDGDEGAVHRVADLRLRVDGLNAALTVLERRRGLALVGHKHAEAADLLHQAAAKAAELGTLEKKTAKLLESLSDLEGVKYNESILVSMRAGIWYAPGQREPAAFEGLADGCYPDPTTARHSWAEPHSKKLRSEIADLLHQADGIEAALAEPEPQPVQGSEPEGKNWSDASYRNPVAAE